MEKVILCSGTYAKTPYCIEENGLNLYSVEELNYYLYKNSFVIQEDFFNESLFDWIATECGLPEWADYLRELKSRGAFLIEYLEYLFEKTGYYEKDEIEKVKKVLKGTKHLSLNEKRRLRADAFLKRGKVAVAAEEYEALLHDMTDDDDKFRASLFHNLGVCDAKLFQFEKAAEEFWKAYRTYPNTESYVQFLTALKLGSGKEEYLDYLSKHTESYEDSLEVERRISELEMKWKEQHSQEFISELSRKNGMAEYETVAELMKKMKEEYMNMIRKG